MFKQKGFTLIELIAVIILLGILSVSTLGRLSDSQDQQLVLLKNQLLSSLHLAQQLSLSRQNQTSSNPVNFQLTRTSSDWTLRVVQGSTTISQHQVDAENIQLHVSTTDFASACTALPQANSQTVNFDGNGDLQSGTRLRLCLDGDQTLQLCISASGYAYEGAACL